MSLSSNALLSCQANPSALPAIFEGFEMKDTRRKIFEWLYLNLREVRCLRVSIKELVRNTSLSQRTVYLGLRDLEDWNIIKRSKAGRFNRITLCEETQWFTVAPTHGFQVAS